MLGHRGGERGANELDVMAHRYRRERLYLLWAGWSCRGWKLWNCGWPADFTDESLEITLGGDHQPSTTRRRIHPIRVRHALTSENHLTGPDATLLLSSDEPKLSLQDVEQLVLRAMDMQRR